MNLQNLVNHPVFPVASLLVTTLSVILAIVFFRRSRREKRPRYLLRQRTIIENRQPLLPGLSVSFDGQLQPEITVTRITLWNAGAETIRREDIAHAKPLQVKMPSGLDVLSVMVLKTTEPANAFAVGTQRQEADGTTAIPFTFDYIDQGDGAVVQIVHNGTEKVRPSVEGLIKGAGGFEREMDFHSYFVKRQKLLQPFMMPFLNSPRAFGVFAVLMFGVPGVAIVAHTIATGQHYVRLLIGCVMLIFSWSYYSLLLKPVVPRGLGGDPEEP